MKANKNLAAVNSAVLYWSAVLVQYSDHTEAEPSD